MDEIPAQFGTQNSEVLPNPIASSPKQSNSIRRILLVIALLALTLVGIGVFVFRNNTSKPQSSLLSPTPSSLSHSTDQPTIPATTDPLIGWKTYRSRSLFYKISLPPSWQVDELVGAFGPIGVGKTEVCEFPPSVKDICIQITIPSGSIPSALASSLDEYLLKGYHVEVTPGVQKTDEYEKISFQGYEGAKLVRGSIEGKELLIIIKKRSSFYEVRVEPHNSELMGVFNQVFSSLKLLIPDDLRSWKTLEREDLPYYFAYPQAWSGPEINTLSTRREAVFDNGDLIISDGFYYNQDLGRNLTFEEFVQSYSKDSRVKEITKFQLGDTLWTFDPESKPPEGRIVELNQVAEGKKEVFAVLSLSPPTNLMMISYRYPENKEDESIALFHYLLSTFQVTSQGSVEE